MLATRVVFSEFTHVYTSMQVKISLLRVSPARQTKSGQFVLRYLCTHLQNALTCVHTYEKTDYFFLCVGILLIIVEL